MTGYGQSSFKTDTLEISVQIRTVNSKNFDLSLQIPDLFASKESEVKAWLNQELQRGRIYCQIKYRSVGDPVIPPINKQMVQHYFEQLKEISDQLGVSADAELLRMVLDFPDIRQTEEKDEAELEAQCRASWPKLDEHLRQALSNCLDFREHEGKAMQEKISDYIGQIQNLLEQAREVEKERIPHIRKRLELHMQDFRNAADFDPTRFEQELLYYSERLDVTEEQDRLEAHLRHFMETVSRKNRKPKGKRLNFIAQEIGREVNTMGSKANYAPLQHLVVSMKEEVEKIKEQVLNIV